MLYTAVHIIHSILYGIVVAVCADMDMHMDMEGLPELSHYEHRSNNESLIAYFGLHLLRGIIATVVVTSHRTTVTKSRNEFNSPYTFGINDLYGN